MHEGARGDRLRHATSARFWIVARGRAARRRRYGHVALDGRRARRRSTRPTRPACAPAGRDDGAARAAPAVRPALLRGLSCATPTGSASRSSRARRLSVGSAPLPFHEPPLGRTDTHARTRRNQRLRPHRPQRLPRRPGRRAPTSSGSPSTTSPTPRRSRTCSSTTRSSARTRARSRSTDDGIVVDGKQLKVLAERDPGDAAVGRPRRRRRDRVDRLLHQARGRRQAPRRGRQEGHHLGAGQGRGHHGRPRRQLRHSTTRTSTTSSPTRRARRTAWRRSPRSSTTRSASSTA